MAPLHFAGPPSSMARLSRSSTQPSRELSYSTPLPRPFCEPVRLFCGREPEELPKDPAEEAARGAVDGRELKSWSRRRRRPRKPTWARLWRVHVALTTRKQLFRCVRHQCALLELFKLRLQHPPELACNHCAPVSGVPDELEVCDVCCSTGRSASLSGLTGFPGQDIVLVLWGPEELPVSY